MPIEINIMKIMIQNLSTGGFYFQQWPHKENSKNTENFLCLFLQSTTLRGHKKIAQLKID